MISPPFRAGLDWESSLSVWSLSIALGFNRSSCFNVPESDYASENLLVNFISPKPILEVWPPELETVNV